MNYGGKITIVLFCMEEIVLFICVFCCDTQLKSLRNDRYCRAPPVATGIPQPTFDNMQLTSFAPQDVVGI